MTDHNPERALAILAMDLLLSSYPVSAKHADRVVRALHSAGLGEVADAIKTVQLTRYDGSYEEELEAVALLESIVSSLGDEQ